MRRWDIVYFAGWDFINYWPNFLEGMNQKNHAWKQSIYHKDREDGIDGWGSPVIKLTKKYFHPYLVMDLGIHEMNGPDSDFSKWSESTSSYSPGDMIERDLEVFNDGLKGNEFTLIWEARWDSAKGELVDSGKIDKFIIEPGFHSTINLSFKAPYINFENRKLFLVYASILKKNEVFREEDIYYWIKK